MKRRELLRHIKRQGCQLFREGKKHTIYMNPAKRKTSTVPRHTEISNKLAIKICKDLEIPVP